MQDSNTIPVVKLQNNKPQPQTETREERAIRIAREAKQWLADNAWVA